jgi:hypothetical protein
MITEPTTMLTDYVLAGLCFFFVQAVWRRSKGSRGPGTHLWIVAFGVTGIAAVAGGTAHGFRGPLGDDWARVWAVTVWSIGLGSVLLIAAGVRSALRSKASSGAERREGIVWLKRAIGVSLVALAVLVGKLSLHHHFNQNDLYHVIQMGGLYCLYRGALLLEGLSAK